LREQPNREHAWQNGLSEPDIYEDIKNNKGLSNGVKRVCRLCQEDGSTESRAHLLLNCKATLDLRNHNKANITQEGRDMLCQLSDQEKVMSLLNSFETPLRIRSSDEHRRVENGQEIKTTEDLNAVLNRDNGEALTIGINCKKMDNTTFTVAYEIFTTKSEVFKECFEVKTKSETEVCNLSVIAALSAIRHRCSEREIPDTIALICMNSLLGNGLPKARITANKQRLLRIALEEVDSIPRRTRIITHHVSGKFGVSQNRYMCLPKTHQNPTLSVESEHRRTERWQKNTDEIALLIYQINQRLNTRKHMEKHRGYR
jgi:hypothetical protein